MAGLDELRRKLIRRWKGVSAAGLLLAASAAAARAQVVDSVHPPEVELARFRETTAGPVARLHGGAPSREALVQRFVRALQTRDTAALRSMLLDRAEFAYLYYPRSDYTRPPYRQSPALVWFRLSNASEKGMWRILARDGGRPLGYRGHRCADEPEVRGPQRIWRSCVLTLAEGATVRQRRLFGSILELGGQFKFLTYASEY